MLCDVRGRDTGSRLKCAAVCHGERESPHGYLVVQSYILAAYDPDILSAGLYPHFFRIGFVLVNSQFSLDRGYNVVLPFADSRPPKPSGDGILAYPVVRPFIL
jgi:hypothetical protein